MGKWPRPLAITVKAILVRVSVVALLLLMGVMLASCGRQQPTTHEEPVISKRIVGSGTSHPKTVEPLPDETVVDAPIPAPKSKPRQMPWLTTAQQPRLALIIDDWGYQRSAEKAFLQLDIPLTAAIIPFLPHSESSAQAAAAAGFDIIVHLPMEPDDASLSSMDGMIKTSMTDEEISAAVIAALQAIPGAQGINNHMGSKASADERVMRCILTQMKQAGLFFVDSRTSSHSVAASVGDVLEVPVLERLVFLDGKDEQNYINGQLREAANLALQRGYAVAIGHVRSGTVEAISAMLPDLENMGVQLVRISEFVKSEHTLQEPAE